MNAIRVLCINHKTNQTLVVKHGGAEPLVEFLRVQSSKFYICYVMVESIISIKVLKKRLATTMYLTCSRTCPLCATHRYFGHCTYRSLWIISSTPYCFCLQTRISSIDLYWYLINENLARIVCQIWATMMMNIISSLGGKNPRGGQSSMILYTCSTKHFQNNP